MMKTNRKFAKKFDFPEEDDQEESNIGVRGAPFVCCKVGNLQNI